jgi:small subunit ribosomal protein S8
MSYPLADMLARLRNAQAAGHQTVTVPFSSLKESVLKALEREGYIRNVSVRELPRKNPKKAAQKELYVELKYDGGRPVIRKITVVSKPGRRQYAAVDALKPVQNGLGISIVTTSKGVLSDHEAKQQNVSGELLCTVA